MMTGFSLSEKEDKNEGNEKGQRNSVVLDYNLYRQYEFMAFNIHSHGMHRYKNTHSYMYVCVCHTYIIYFLALSVERD